VTFKINYIRMKNIILLLTGSITLIIWGIAHLFPTKSVVRGFGDISIENKNILRMEWITEGFSLIFAGTLVLLITIIGNNESITSRIVFIASSFFLFSMAILSFLTGYKVNFLPYKLCPFIFSLSGTLILFGCFL
jgi:hypothetical protein